MHTLLGTANPFRSSKGRRENMQGPGQERKSCRLRSRRQNDWKEQRHTILQNSCSCGDDDDGDVTMKGMKTEAALKSLNLGQAHTQVAAV